MSISRVAGRIYSKANHSIVNGLTIWLAEVYATPQAWVRRLGTRPLYELRRRLQHSDRSRKLNLSKMQGTVPGSGLPLRVGVLMESKGLDFAQWLFFGESQVCRETRARVNASSLVSVARDLAAEADLLFVERSNLEGWLPPSGVWVHGPARLRMVYDYTPGQSWPELEKSFRKQEMNIRRIKRAGFHYRITRSPADLEFFYQNMYVPLVQARHTEYGTIKTLADVQAETKNAFLMLVEDSAGQPVSGAMLHLSGDTMIGLFNGVLDGRNDLVQAGAMSALYYFSLKIGCERGLRRFDAGLVRPLARHGLYLYKSRWNLRPIPDLWNNRDWLFWAPTGNEAALGWLEEHPLTPEFTRTSAGRLEAVYQAMRG